ncbi:hypothetical protein H0264_34135 [Nocardia huaxiensis]|uniref:Uncharacterized protein n=1 Tax=Nocardia huaxiensis TaxID=2755382 RepID=A0A7D6VA60_9NOCA|nr:hypothetical protein [Nocardia huaxiensis]QLY30153.1 hypothetical protein H0264_34135 [Nocardia huaxiensis]
MTTVSSLPAYGDFVSQVEQESVRAGRRWPFAVLTVIGVLLVAAPLVTGMFPRAIKGEAMIDAFQPYVSAQSIAGYRDDLRVLDDARANVLALQANSQQPGRFERVETFVRDYPGIRSDLTGMLDSIDGNRESFGKLSSTTSFGSLPWLLALAGLLLITAGLFGYRAAGDSERGTIWYSLAVLAALGLLAVPLTGGLFRAAPAAQPVIDSFRPILTHQKVREIQGYFVILVAADGELNSRYVAAVRETHPDADLTGITALETSWQPMTARFAALVGVLNDNIRNFDAVVALNNSTKPLGFTAFHGLGWGFLIPGVAVLGVALAGLWRRPADSSARIPRTDSGAAHSTEGDPT